MLSQIVMSEIRQAFAHVNEMKVQWFKCVRKPTRSRLSLTHHSNKSSRWAE